MCEMLKVDNQQPFDVIGVLDTLGRSTVPGPDYNNIKKWLPIIGLHKILSALNIGTTFLQRPDGTYIHAL